MEQSDILRRKKQQYIDLLEQISRTCQQLDTGIKNLDNISGQTVQAYSIDGQSADHNYLVNTANQARQIHNHLAYSVMPAIEQQINILGEQIADAIVKESLARS